MVVGVSYRAKEYTEYHSRRFGINNEKSGLAYIAMASASAPEKTLAQAKLMKLNPNITKQMVRIVLARSEHRLINAMVPNCISRFMSENTVVTNGPKTNERRLARRNAPSPGVP